jgi:hypothetical protein
MTILQTKWQHYRFAFFCPNTKEEGNSCIFLLRPGTPALAFRSVYRHFAMQIKRGNMRASKVDLKNITFIITPCKTQPKYTEPK